MGVEFTPNQQQVIDTRDKNILVSAAAGSGKTAVLVERIFQRLMDEKNPIDIDKMLIVTFTEAAAREMRERIGLRIADALVTDPGNEHLQKQTTLVHNALITTIHSFCLFIIRNNFAAIDLDPGFRVADDGEMKLLQAECMEQLLEEKYAQADSSFLRCVDFFQRGKTDERLEEFIRKVYNAANNAPFPKDWFVENHDGYKVETVEDLNAQLYIGWIQEYIRTALAEAIEAMDVGIEISSMPGGAYNYIESFEEDKEEYKRLLGECTTFSAMCKAFATFDPPKIRTKNRDSEKELAEAAKAIRDRWKDLMKEIKNSFLSTPLEAEIAHMNSCNEINNTLLQLAEEYMDRINEQKKDRKILTFSDMEHYALQILTYRDPEGQYLPTKAALDYRKYFEEIMTDEYQDSNLVQEIILSMVARPGSRFMVGDVKQSIYRFRNARPDLFLDKSKRYAVETKENVRILLDKNFRSRQEVLDFTNYVFRRVMISKIGGIDYTQEEYLNYGASYIAPPEADAKAFSAELMVLDADPDAETESVKGASTHEKEANMVADRIRQMVGTFEVTRNVTDAETGMKVQKLEPCSYKDIVILLRSTSGGIEEAYREVFKRKGIPLYSASKTGYFSAPEIRILLDYLKVLYNTGSDIALYAAMTGPLGHFTDEDMAQLKILFDALPKAVSEDGEQIHRKYALWEKIRILLSNDMPELEDALRTKLGAFCDEVDGYRKRATYIPIHELIEMIIRDHHYLYHVMSLPDGEQRLANVDMLIERAKAFEQTSFYGLYHFIRYMGQLEKYEVDYGEANILDESADVVRIMTIHGSKGLEFPICFVSGLGKMHNRQDLNDFMLMDNELGIAFDFVDPDRRLQCSTLKKRVIRKKLLFETIGEELRILYVALTRAKEKLILTGCVKKAEEEVEKKLHALPGVNPLSMAEIEKPDKYLKLLFEILAGTEDILKVIAITPKDMDAAQKDEVQELVIGEEKFQTERVDKIDTSVVTEVSERLDKPYKHKELEGLFTKTSVSEIKMKHAQAYFEEHESDGISQLIHEEDTPDYIPKFAGREDTLSGTAMGTAVHRIMELIDFCAIPDTNQKEWLEQCCHTFEQEGRLEEGLFEKVNMTKMVNFLNSDLCARMKRAAKAGKLWKEQPFVLGLSATELEPSFPQEETVLIQGVIDAFFEEEGQIVLMDYKTDRIRDEQELRGRYATQLAYYARAIEQINGMTVKEKIMYSFGLETSVYVP